MISKIERMVIIQTDETVEKITGILGIAYVEKTYKIFGVPVFTKQTYKKSFLK